MALTRKRSLISTLCAGRVMPKSSPAAIHVLVSVLLLASCADADNYVWNNSTSGDWTDSRWQLNGVPDPLVCCPGPFDKAAVNATAGIAPTWVYVYSYQELDELEIGPRPSSNYIAVQFSTGSTLVPRTALTAHPGGYLLVINQALLVIPSSSNVVFEESSRLYLASSGVACAPNASRQCTLRMNGGSLFLLSGFFADLVNINWIMHNHSSALELKGGAYLQVRNSTADLARTTTSIQQGFLHFQSSSVAIDESLLMFYAAAANMAALYFEDSTAVLTDLDLFCAKGNIRITVQSNVTIETVTTTTTYLFNIFGDSRITIADQGTTLAISNYRNITVWNTANFFVRNGALLKFISSNMTLIDSSQILIGNSSTVVVRDSEVRLWDEAVLAIADDSHLIGSTGSVLYLEELSILTCQNSEMMFETVHLNSFAISLGCNVLFNTSLSAAQDSRLLLNNSFIHVNSDSNFATRSLLSISDDSAFVVLGTLTCHNATMLVYSSFVAIDGNLAVDACENIDSNVTLSDLTAEIVANHPSCLTSFLNSSLAVDGNTLLGDKSLTFLSHSIARINGTVTVGERGLLVLSEARIYMAGRLEFHRNARLVGRVAEFRVLNGSIHLIESSSILIANGLFYIDGGSLILDAGANMSLPTSGFTISGGGVQLNGYAQRGPLAYGIFAVYAPMNIEGGNITMNGSVDLVAAASRIIISGGSIIGTNDSTITATAGAILLIEGGNIELDSSAMRIGFHSNALISSGDIRLRNRSFLIVERQSALGIRGSIYLENNCILIVSDASSLIVQNGSIFLAGNTTNSFVMITSNSTLAGVGSINGTVFVQDGFITYDSSSSVATELSIVALTQTNQSTFQVSLSSEYATGTSTIIKASGSVELAGKLVVNVSSSIESKLRSGERIELIYSEQGFQGQFETISWAVPDTLSCGLTTRVSAKSLSVLFDPILCVIPAAEQPSDPTSGVAGSNAGMIAGIIIAVIVVVALVIFIVLVFKIPALKRAVMPWRARGAASTRDHELASDSEPLDSDGGAKSAKNPANSWQSASRPSSNL